MLLPSLLFQSRFTTQVSVMNHTFAKSSAHLNADNERTEGEQSIVLLDLDASFGGLRVHPVGLSSTLAPSGFDRNDCHGTQFNSSATIWSYSYV